MKKNILCIVGPTAVGKSDIAIDLALKINTEILSSDSMQIYKYMDIGTAKITNNEMRGINHHIIDIINPNEIFTVSDFKKSAYKIIDNLNKVNKLPIIVGGTGLYINSILYNLNFISKPNIEIKNKYLNLFKSHGNKYIYDILISKDPIAANDIHINNIPRIIRALEIIDETGDLFSNQNKKFKEPNIDFNIKIIGLTTNRQELYKKINFRVDFMINNGLIDEVEFIIKKFPDFKYYPSSKGIGYKEVIEYLDGSISKLDMIEKIKINSRRFAKRQYTWFNNNNSIKWFNIDNFNNRSSLLNSIYKYIKTDLLD